MASRFRPTRTASGRADGDGAQVQVDLEVWRRTCRRRAFAVIDGNLVSGRTFHDHGTLHRPLGSNSWTRSRRGPITVRNLLCYARPRLAHATQDAFGQWRGGPGKDHPMTEQQMDQLFADLGGEFARSLARGFPGRWPWMRRSSASP